MKTFVNCCNQLLHQCPAVLAVHFVGGDLCCNLTLFTRKKILQGLVLEGEKKS